MQTTESGGGPKTPIQHFYHEPAKPPPSYGGGSTYDAPSTPAPAATTTVTQTETTKLQPYTGTLQGPVPQPPAVLPAWENYDQSSSSNPLVQAYKGQTDDASHTTDTQTATGAEHDMRVAEGLIDKTYKPRKTFAMTWKDYQALSPEQQGAVNFNTMLVNAREKDLNTNYHPEPAQTLAYQDAVTKMFGEDGGSDTYAPETLAVLQQIDYHNEKSDLDNFLGLKEAITVKDLKGFSMPDTTTDVTSALGSMQQPSEQQTLQATLIEHTQELQSALEQGNQVIRNFQTSAAIQRGDLVDYLGGNPANPLKMPGLPGWGMTPKDKSFQGAFEALAYNQNDPAEVWAKITSVMGEDVPDFIRYAQERTQGPESYGLDTSSGQYRTPKEYRELLKIGEAP
jgi:hypothetical protein